MSTKNVCLWRYRGNRGKRRKDEVCASMRGTTSGLGKETEDPSLRLASTRSPSLLSVLFDDFLWVNDESLEFASSLSVYCCGTNAYGGFGAFFDIDAFFLWIKAFFQALQKRASLTEGDTNKSGGVLIPF